MKNLANCKPSEFLAQTNKIKKSVDRWLTDTDVVNIRMRKPDIKDEMSEEDKQRAIREQVNKNFNDIFSAVVEEHPEETLEVLALICFVEPKDVDSHTMTEYLDTISEVLNNQSVIGFFTSLTNWGPMRG